MAGITLVEKAPAKSIIQNLLTINNSLYYVADGLFQKYRKVEMNNAEKILKMFNNLLIRINGLKKTLELSLSNDKSKDDFARRIVEIKKDIEGALYTISNVAGAGVLSLAKEHLSKDTKSMQELINEFQTTLSGLEKLVK